MSIVSVVITENVRLMLKPTHSTSKIIPWSGVPFLPPVESSCSVARSSNTSKVSYTTNTFFFFSFSDCRQQSQQSVSTKGQDHNTGVVFFLLFLFIERADTQRWSRYHDLSPPPALSSPQRKPRRAGRHSCLVVTSPPHCSCRSFKGPLLVRPMKPSALFYLV